MKLQAHNPECLVKRGDIFYDVVGKQTVMAVADNYCMVRRPYCNPRIFTVQEIILFMRSQERDS